jgi:hypothetical protein
LLSNFTLQYGQQASGELVLGNPTDTYTFSAAAGGTIQAYMTSSGANGQFLQSEIQLNDPNGNPVTTGTASSAGGTASLDTTASITGTYSLVAESANEEGGAYVLEVIPVSGTLENTVVPGQTYQGTTSSQPEVFSLAASQGNFIEASTGDAAGQYPDLDLDLYDPAGNLLDTTTGFVSGTEGVVSSTASITGTYYLVEGATGAMTAPYDLSAVVMPMAVPSQNVLVSGEGATGTLTGQLDLSGLAVTAGQTVVASVGTNGPNGNDSRFGLQAFDPSGNLVAAGVPSSTDVNSTVSFTATSTGTYAFVISSADASPLGTYGLSAVAIPGPQVTDGLDNAGGSISSGQSATGSFEGQFDAYTVTVAAGQMIQIAITGSSATAAIFDPAGTLVSANGSALASSAGTYTIVAESSNGQIGSYTLSLDLGFPPATIDTAYSINQISFDGASGTGAGQTIAIVDPYNNPDIETDLAAFDSAMNLPAPPSFEVVDENGNTVNPATTAAPPSSAASSTLFEIDLDVEWSHAVAPDADIVLVEAASLDNSDLTTAIQTAAGLPGVSVVSMSFTSSTALSQSTFTTPSGHAPVTFIASSGDSGQGTYYPAALPNVLAVGGTTLQVADSTDDYQSETLWSNTGGGSGGYGVNSGAEPAYQTADDPSAGGRVYPDVAFDGDPNTGVLTYGLMDATNGDPWSVGAGTSLGAPAWSGLIAIADQGRVAAGLPPLDGGNDVLPLLYNLPATDFHKVGSGVFNTGTGLGSPVANLLIPDLVDSSSAKLAFAAQPASATAGSAISVVVDVDDLNGNVVTFDDSDVTLSIASGPSAATLGSTLTVAAINGVAQFDVTPSKPGAYTLSVTDGSLAPATSATFSVGQLVITQQPANATAGADITVVVNVEKPSGKTIASDGSDVTLAVTKGPAGAVLNGTATVATVNGVAIFSGLSLTQAGTYKFTAADGDLSIKTVLFTVSPGAPADFAFIEQPSDVMAGQKFSPKVSVSMTDAFGNPITGKNAKLSIASGPGGAVLNGTLAKATSNGTATFGNINLTEAGTYTLNLTHGTLAGVASSSFTVTADAPAEVAFIQRPATATVGAAITPPIVVDVEDQFGNPVSTDDSDVTLIIKPGSGPAGAILDGTLTVTAQDGVATFSDLSLSEAGTYKLKATDGILTKAKSVNFTVGPAPD